MTDKHDAHDKHGAPDKDQAAHPKDAPDAPPVQEYPKMLYGVGGASRVVATADEEAAAKKEGFAAQPGAADAHAHPTKERR
jgi:hypothetical protein